MLHNEDLTVLESGPENEEFTATLERVITWKMQSGLYCGDGIRLSLDSQQWNLWLFADDARDWICLHAALPFDSVPDNLPIRG